MCCYIEWGKTCVVCSCVTIFLYISYIDVFFMRNKLCYSQFLGAIFCFITFSSLLLAKNVFLNTILCVNVCHFERTQIIYSARCAGQHSRLSHFASQHKLLYSYIMLFLLLFFWVLLFKCFQIKSENLNNFLQPAGQLQSKDWKKKKFINCDVRRLRFNRQLIIINHIMFMCSDVFKMPL